MNVGNVSK